MSPVDLKIFFLFLNNSVCVRVSVCVCSWTCYILSTKICILLVKWRHFSCVHMCVWIVVYATLIHYKYFQQPQGSAAEPSSMQKPSLAASQWEVVSTEQPPPGSQIKKRVEVLKGSTIHLDPCSSAPLFLRERVWIIKLAKIIQKKRTGCFIQASHWYE